MLKRYLSCLKLELERLKELNVRASLDSVYIGGGTPTIYSAYELGELLDAVGATFIIAVDGVEVSLECAPSTARSYNEWRTYFNVLAGRKKLPVTRLSFGVQTGDAASLRHMGRVGGEVAALALLRAADDMFESYNADFLLNYPTISTRASLPRCEPSLLDWLDSCRASKLRLPSISLYQLWDVDTIPIGRAKHVNLLDEEKLLERKWTLQEGIFSRKLAPALISTVVQESRHASAFFKNRHSSFCQIGCGSGAYSIFPREFVTRPRNIEEYMLACEEGPVFNTMSSCYNLTHEETEIRRLIMGLRSFEWIDASLLAETECKSFVSLGETVGRIQNLVTLGLVLKDKKKFRFSDDAFLIGNELSTYLHPSSHSRRAEYNGGQSIS